MANNPYSDFFADGDFTFRRPRTLDPSQQEVAPEAAANQRKPEEVNQDFVNAIYDSYRRAMEKATILLPAISKVANKYTIPVDINSIEVRRAVIRQDPDVPDGSIITFDLFTRMVDIVERQAQAVDFDVINTKVIADPLATERTIRKRIDSRVGDSEISSLLLVGANILVLFILHEITGIWRGTEHTAAQPKTAGPFPTETISSMGEAIREAAVGVAAANIILGLNQALMTLALNDGNSDAPNANTIVQGALAEAKQVKLPPLLETAKTVLGLDDYKLIIKYVIKYVSETTERGYEFWWAYIMTRRTRYLSALNLSFAPIFSKKEYSIKNLQWDIDKPWVEPDDIQLNPIGVSSTPSPDYLSTQLVSLLNRSVVQPTDAYLCAMDYEASNFERGLNYVAQVLDTKIARDAICCLVRFLGNIDADLLKKIAAILRIFLNNNMIDLSATMTNFMSLLASWIRDTLIRLLMTLIQSILDKIAKLVAKFINELAGDLKFLIECPLIMDLIMGIIDAIDAIIQDLEEILENYVTGIVLNTMVSLGLNEFDASNKGLRPGLLRIHRKRSISRILRILDAIISVLEQDIRLCEEDDGLNRPGTTITFNQAIDSPLIGDLEDYLDIPQVIKDKYFADAVEIRFEDGTYIPPYTKGVVDIGVPGQAPPTCIQNFNQASIKQVLGDWVRVGV